MSRRRGLQLLLILLLVGVYGYRTVGGIRGGWALDRGRLLRNLGNYTEAAPRLESAAVGFDKLRALLMAGEVRLDQWEKEVRRRGALGADRTEIVRAAEDFLRCRCLAPASRRSWKGLGEVYDAVEWVGREYRAEIPYVPPDNPWQRVGRPGRVAVGMLRVALEVAPTWGGLHDRLALTLWNYGLEDAARLAVRESAWALPIYSLHPYDDVPELPDWVAREFADASREVLGKVPLFSRNSHLLDLGKLERRIGANERAIGALREVLAAENEPLRHAEASFQLGLALVAEGRYEEGGFWLRSSAEHPVFRVSALRNLAGLAERRGDLERALGYLRQLRREQPDELWPCLQFADVARRLEEWPAALEALRWAKLKHASDPRPYAGLVEIHLQRGDLTSASSVLGELEDVAGPDTEEVRRLKREIAASSRAGKVWRY